MSSFFRRILGKNDSKKELTKNDKPIISYNNNRRNKESERLKNEIKEAQTLRSPSKLARNIAMKNFMRNKDAKYHRNKILNEEINKTHNKKINNTLNKLEIGNYDLLYDIINNLFDSNLENKSREEFKKYLSENPNKKRDIIKILNFVYILKYNKSIKNNRKDRIIENVKGIPQMKISIGNNPKLLENLNAYKKTIINNIQSYSLEYNKKEEYEKVTSYIMSKCDDEKSINYIYESIIKLLFNEKNSEMLEIKSNSNKKSFINKFILLSLKRKKYDAIINILKAVYRLKYNKNINSSKINNILKIENKNKYLVELQTLSIPRPYENLKGFHNFTTVEYYMCDGNMSGNINIQNIQKLSFISPFYYANGMFIFNPEIKKIISNNKNLIIEGLQSNEFKKAIEEKGIKMKTKINSSNSNKVFNVNEYIDNIEAFNVKGSYFSQIFERKILGMANNQGIKNSNRKKSGEYINTDNFNIFCEELGNRINCMYIVIDGKIVKKYEKTNNIKLTSDNRIILTKDLLNPVKKGGGLNSLLVIIPKIVNVIIAIGISYLFYIQFFKNKSSIKIIYTSPKLLEQQRLEQELREKEILQERQLEERRLQQHLLEKKLLEKKILEERIREERQLYELQLEKLLLGESSEKNLKNLEKIDQDLKKQKLNIQKLQQQNLQLELELKQENREQQLREQERREQQLREQQLREQQLREQQRREQELREQQRREQELREPSLPQQSQPQEQQPKTKKMSILEILLGVIFGPLIYIASIGFEIYRFLGIFFENRK
jgi:hypothetical protein